MIVIYVNDLIFTKLNLATIFWLKNALNKRFEMNDLNSCIYYLDMMIFRNWNLKQLILNQNVYVEQILQDHEMWNCKSLIIFMNVSCRLIKTFDEYIADKSLRISYQLIVKSLMYIMLEIRSNIIYSISMRIFRYLRKTHQMKLMFREALKCLENYTNSNWTKNQDIRRSISEYAFNVDSDVINWFSKRQFIVTLSICEIEYTKQILAAKEVIWLRNLMIQLTCDVEYFQAVMIYENNQSVIIFVKNFQFHARTKHIDIQTHFIKKKNDQRIYWSVLRAHRSNDSWRFNQIIDQRQIRSVSRCFKDWIVDTFCDNDLWKLNNQVRIKSQNFLLYNFRSTLSVVFVYTVRIKKKFFRLYDKIQKVQFKFDFSES
jgi:hypothetical protein